MLYQTSSRNSSRRYFDDATAAGSLNVILTEKEKKEYMQGIKTHYANVDNFFMTPGVLATVKMAEVDLNGMNRRIPGACPASHQIYAYES